MGGEGCGVPYGLIAAEDDWLARLQVSKSLYLCQWSSYVAAYGVSILQLLLSVVFLNKRKNKKIINKDAVRAGMSLWVEENKIWNRRTKNHDLISGREKRFFYFPEHPDQLWTPAVSSFGLQRSRR